MYLRYKPKSLYHWVLRCQFAYSILTRGLRHPHRLIDKIAPALLLWGGQDRLVQWSLEQPPYGFLVVALPPSNICQAALRSRLSVESYHCLHKYEEFGAQNPSHKFRKKHSQCTGRQDRKIATLYMGPQVWKRFGQAPVPEPS